MYVGYLLYLILLFCLSLRGLKNPFLEKGKTDIPLTLRTDKRFTSFSGARVF
jgi:hypothetical protein